MLIVVFARTARSHNFSELQSEIPQSPYHERKFHVVGVIDKYILITVDYTVHVFECVIKRLESSIILTHGRSFKFSNNMKQQYCTFK